MNEQQIAWLDRLLVINGVQSSYDKREEQKKAMLEKLRFEQQANIGIYDKAAGLVAEDGGGKTRKLVDREKRDQLKEVDLHDDRDQGFMLRNQQDASDYLDMAALAKKQVGDMMSATTDLFDEKTGEPVMETVKVKRKQVKVDKNNQPVLDKGEPVIEEVDEDVQQPVKVPLFSKEEIAAQVYDPMVRQGLISETGVPNDYSRTQDMLDKSIEAYNERLKRDKKSTAGNFFSENKGLITSSLGLVMTAGSGGMDIKGAHDSPSDALTTWSGKDGLENIQKNLAAGGMKEGDQALKFVAESFSVITDIVMPVGEKIADKLEGGETKSEEVIKPAHSNQLALALYGAAAAELGSKFDAVKLGLEASSAFGGGVPGGEIAKWIREGDLAPIAKALGTSLDLALKALDPKTQGSTALLGPAGAELAKALAGKLDDDALTQALSAGEVETAGTLLGKAGTEAMAAAITQPMVDLFKDPAAQKTAQEAASAKMAEEFLDEGPNKEQEKIHRQAGYDHQGDWVNENEDKPNAKPKWVCIICRANESLDPQAFAGMLERRIKQVERDREILEWALRLTNMGIDLAANFVAPLAAIGSAVKMAKNILEAGLRARDLAVFCEKRNGLMNAASPFSSAVKNFVANSRSQMLHYMANAAFEAVKMIGACLQCGGITAPAGVAVSSAGGIAQALEAVIYEIAKRVNLENAWSTYREYITHKDNRRMGLEAVRANPTLAKYATAWGALVKKDPLVIDFIGACGLTPETLKDPNAELDQVVKYLEVRMPDDLVVTGRAGELDTAGLELNKSRWMKVYVEATKNASLAPKDTGMIVASLGRWTKLSPGWAASADASGGSTLTAPEKKKATDTLGEIGKALKAYKPKTSKNKPCLEMVGVVQRFQVLVGQQQTLVAGWAVKA